MGQLEGQMEQLEEENEKEVGQLNARIWQLEADVERCNRLVVSWSMRCQSLEAELLKERQIREDTQREVTALRRASPGSNDTVPLQPRQHQDTRPNITVTRITEAHLLPAEQEEPAFGCGKCRLDTRCECVESALELMGADDDEPTATPPERTHTPTPMTDDNRSRRGSSKVSPDDDMEIDFTTQSAVQRPPGITTSISSTSITATAALVDPCGFCQDGTACICAELATDERKGNPIMEPLSGLPISKTTLGNQQNPCINGPGTCAQCRSDAKSTLFCKSLAATRSETRARTNSSTASENDNQAAFAEGSSNIAAMTGVSLSCADTYTTLSRHPAYERASEDPGSWMSNLATVPTNTSMTAFEIEAASILQTLRSFDKRFGPGN